MDSKENGMKRFGFMKKQAVKIPENFDRLFENEILKMFTQTPLKAN